MIESNGWWTSVALIVALLGAGGCATSTPVEKAPLAEEKKQALKKQLIGTWRHVATVKNGNRSPAGTENGYIQWTFREDGIMKFRQKMPSVGVDQKRTTGWHLEGRNLVMEAGDKGKKTYYRVDEWSGDEMKWFNYTASNTFILKRVK
ncbi:MAG: lipocalin family protein [Bradymonadaceae bacterium]